MSAAKGQRPLPNKKEEVSYGPHLKNEHFFSNALLPFPYLQITVKLDLRNNNLQELARGAFSHTPYLTHLNLQRCNINRVKEGAFRALGRVVSLNLAYNKIEILYQVSTDVKTMEGIVFFFLDLALNIAEDFSSTSLVVLQESFDGLSSLKELYLDYNRIEEIQPGAFTQLGFLNMLAITHNQLVYIPNLAFQVLFSISRKHSQVSVPSVAF